MDEEPSVSLQDDSWTIRKCSQQRPTTLATCVIGIWMCQGGDEYNDRVARRYSETLDDGSTRESYKYHESTPDSVAKFGDFAASLLLTDSNGERDSIEGLDGVFVVHKHEEGSNSNHQPLPVVKGAYDPVRNKAYDLYGAKSGITQVTVNDVDREYEVDTGRWMRGLILLDESRSSPRPTGGDSGAPIVVEDSGWQSANCCVALRWNSQ